jgi:hypothetical protein
MPRNLNLSGIGLGIYIIGFGICYILQQTNGFHMIDFWLGLYPILVILLGLDFILANNNRTAKLFSKPSPMVVTIIILLIIFGSLNGLSFQTMKFTIPRLEHFGCFKDRSFNWNQGPRFTVDRNFKLPSGITTVKVQNQFGDIQVDSASDNTISAKAQIKMRFNHKPLLQNQFRLVGEVQGDTLLIKLDAPPKRFGSFNRLYFNSNIILNVPNGLSVTVENSAGDVEVASISGNLNVEAIAGDVRIKSVGRDLKLSSKFGDVDIDNIMGNADISTQSGEINIDNIMGNADISTQSGEINIKTINGNSRIESISGEVTLEKAYQPVNIELKSGNLRINLAKISGNCDIDLTSGNIELGIPADAHFALNTESMSGNIESNFNVAVKRDFARVTASGAINGGGPLIKVRNKSGNIRVNKIN